MAIEQLPVSEYQQPSSIDTLDRVELFSRAEALANRVAAVQDGDTLVAYFEDESMGVGLSTVSIESRADYTLSVTDNQIFFQKHERFAPEGFMNHGNESRDTKIVVDTNGEATGEFTTDEAEGIIRSESALREIASFFELLDEEIQQREDSLSQPISA